MVEMRYYFQINDFWMPKERREPHVSCLQGCRDGEEGLREGRSHKGRESPLRVFLRLCLTLIHTHSRFGFLSKVLVAHVVALPRGFSLSSICWKDRAHNASCKGDERRSNATACWGLPSEPRSPANWHFPKGVIGSGKWRKGL